MTKLACLVFALFTSAAGFAADPRPLALTVEGVQRTGLVFEPSAKDKPVPLILVFHGHGGGAGPTAKAFHLQVAWPDALVVYLQGLPTKTPKDPEGARPGWQIAPGQNGDRDFKLTDAVLAWAHDKYPIDDKRTFAAGFSNGAGFSFLLWSLRPNKFTAFGIVANSIRDEYPIRIAKPLIHIAGRKDQTAKFEKQLVSIETAKKINGTTGSEPCGDGCTRYTSPQGTPVVAVIHPGGHVVPPWAGPRIVEFFKHHGGR